MPVSTCLIQIQQKNGITYALLAYTYGTNGIPLPKGKEYLVNVYTKKMLKDDIENIRKKVDFLMVSMHWGIEYDFTPSQEQRDLAKFLADLGVDLIIGTHPHVVQPAEWIVRQYSHAGNAPVRMSSTMNKAASIIHTFPVENSSPVV